MTGSGTTHWPDEGSEFERREWVFPLDSFAPDAPEALPDLERWMPVEFDLEPIVLVVPSG